MNYISKKALVLLLLLLFLNPKKSRIVGIKDFFYPLVSLKVFLNNVILDLQNVLTGGR